MRRRRIATLVALVVLMLGVRPTQAAAQAAISTRPQPEVRADLIVGSQAAIQGGVGLQVPFGYYVRVGADVAVGSRTGTHTSTGLGGRVDVLGRFLLDPFRQSPFGVSAGAGLSARFEPGERVTPLLLVALDVEGRRRRNGWTPALQLGLGGGARIGLVLRRGEAGSR